MSSIEGDEWEVGTPLTLLDTSLDPSYPAIPFPTATDPVTGTGAPEKVVLNAFVPVQVRGRESHCRAEPHRLEAS